VPAITQAHDNGQATLIAHIRDGQITRTANLRQGSARPLNGQPARQPQRPARIRRAPGDRVPEIGSWQRMSPFTRAVPLQEVAVTVAPIEDRIDAERQARVALRCLLPPNGS
jgi:hypothetical protein